MFLFRCLDVSKENLDVLKGFLFGLLIFAIECIGEKKFSRGLDVSCQQRG